MKTIKTLLVVAALSVSSWAMAEGGADRVNARMEQIRQSSAEARHVAQQQEVKAPVAEQRAEQTPHAKC